MKKEQQALISNMISGFIGIAVELVFIAGILIAALIISYIFTGV